MSATPVAWTVRSCRLKDTTYPEGYPVAFLWPDGSQFKVASFLGTSALCGTREKAISHWWLDIIAVNLRSWLTLKDPASEVQRTQHTPWALEEIRKAEAERDRLSEENARLTEELESSKRIIKAMSNMTSQQEALLSISQGVMTSWLERKSPDVGGVRQLRDKIKEVLP